MQNPTDDVGPADAPEPTPTSGDSTAEPDRVAAEPVGATAEPAPAAPAGTEAPPGAAGPQTWGAPPAPGPTGPPTSNPPPPPGGTSHSSTGDGFFGAMRRIGVVRTDDRWVGGVCSGLAHRFGLDPLLVRGIVAATVLIAGFGLVCYGLAWALLPEARDGRIHLQETLAGRFDAALLGALGMVLLGLIRGDGWLGLGHLPGVVIGLTWLALLATIVVVIVMAVGNRSDRENRPPAPTPPTPGPAAGPSPAPTYPAYPTASYPMPDQPTTYQGTSYQATTAPPGPAPTAAPQWTPPAPVVAQRRLGPGPTVVGVVVALTLIAAAGLLVANRTGHLDAPVALVAAGVCVVLAGLGIVVSGLRGRRSGVLGFIAIVTVLFAGPWAVYEAGDWPHPDGESVVTLNDVGSARIGVDQVVGDVVVDLRNIGLTGGTATPEPEPSAAPDQATDPDADNNADTGADTDTDTGEPTPDGPEAAQPAAPPVAPQTVRVPVNVGMGDVKILLPEGVNTRVEAEIGAGRIDWRVDDPQTMRGVGLRHTFQTDRNADGPELVVQVSVGVGDLTISQKGGL